ncbi:hypothetical protein A5662_01245 [Mycobacteriaceae bacterium 1482268.1]|nr:hypothetical protein A5662_01245 [Mycobacteriaceae bacterium 1482268.1]
MPASRAPLRRGFAGRSRSLVLGISSGVAALFALYKIFWLFFAAATLSNFGYSSFWVVVSVVWWGAIAACGVFWAIAFLARYSSQP